MDSETTPWRPYCIALALIGVLIYSSLLYLALKLAYCFRRRRRHAAAERILDSAPDVPYLPLPEADDQQEASSSSSSCMICMAEYARGEGRFVMPGCCHAFHRGCVAEWLRRGRKTTCPICRVTANVAVVIGSPPPPAAGEEGVVAGVGVGVGTAQDMV